MRMRKVCPNLEREDGLDTVLEVPIPEELFMSNSTSRGCKTGCTNMLPWIKPRGGFRASPEFGFGGAGNGTGSELQLMLGVVGAPLVPLPVQSQHSISTGQIKEDPFEASMAKYIVQQYVAAAGGKAAVNRINSMYAIGKVWMTTTTTTTSEFGNGNDENSRRKKKEMKYVGGEMGGFVLWQKKQPELWCIELVVSGCKLSAGSDGKVAWRQTPWQPSHASRGPPRPLRRTLQGLDPRSTANLFSNSVCIGEKEIDGDDCFVLRLDAEPETLRARSSNNVEIMRHTVWGHFSQRTGLLVQLDDSHLLRMKGATNESESVYWETTMASSIEDYRFIEGINIAHSGRTEVSLFRFGGDGEGPTRTRMEEMWAVEEVDFNIHGLCMDCFLPPSDLHDEKEGCDVKMTNGMRLVRVQGGATKLGYSKVAALNIEEDEHENF